MSYRGSRPFAVMSVSSVRADKAVVVLSNAGERLYLCARLLARMPRTGDDIRELRFAQKDEPGANVPYVRTVYDQTDTLTQDAAATLCGCADGNARATPLFRSTLRAIPALPVGFTVGDVARAYLSAMLAELSKGQS